MSEGTEQVIAGRYQLFEQLGSGGMGVVWRAHDERLRRTVAVKQVRVPAELTEPQGEEMVRRTMREGRIAARLHHPLLITVYDVVSDGGQPYLIMEYFPSKSLARLGMLPYDEVARIGSEAAGALAAAHDAGVVHRDVKPANVLIGEDGTVKITDFGISRVISDLTLTATSTFAGTPAYLAPEVARGSDATFASDVYSLGATLYAAVEGSPPVGEDTNAMKLLYKVSSGEINPPTHAGPLTDVLLWLLSDDPAKRPSMTEARDALAAVAEKPADLAVVPAPVPPPTAKSAAPATAAAPAAAPEATPPPEAAPGGATPPPENRRRRAVLIGSGLLAIAVVAALVTWLLDQQGTTSGSNHAAAPASSRSHTKPTGTTPAPTTTTTTTEVTTTTTTTPPAAGHNPPPQQGQPAIAATPVAAVTEYYGLVPGNLDAAWARLSPKFQQNPGGGRHGYYERFWGAIRSVTASNVVPVGPNKVQVSLLYVKKDGSQERERHEYTLINQNGMWLIDSVRRLSPA
ncbi:serine/threonine-protein kinase [Actinophytocola sp.]|uniref:serine/threonine-protein kinase n=1 Tax=Actinophytocola sp. TaxID=1872138 RepID=UPI00389A18A7